jgi:ribosomal protein S25
MQEMSEQEKEIKRKRTLLTESEKQAIGNCCLERREITPGILNKQLYKFAANILKKFENGEILMGVSQGRRKEKDDCNDFFTIF